MCAVRAQRGDLAIEYGADVDDVVDPLLGRRHQPQLGNRPRLEPLVGQQLGMGERVAGVGVDGGERGLTRGPVVGVRGGSTRSPVTVPAPAADAPGGSRG